MADWPAMVDGHKHDVIGENLSGSSTSSVAATAGTANTEGNWVELVASTSFDAEGFWLFAFHTASASTQTDFQLSIGIGASGAEKKIIDSLLLSRTQDTDGGFNGVQKYFPIPIPAGTRVCAKLRASTASAVLGVSMQMVSHGLLGPPSYGTLVSYGPAAGDSGGISVDPGTTANTIVWVEVTNSTSESARYLYLAIGFQLDTTRTAGSWMITVAKGASGAEANNVIVPQLHCRVAAGADVISPALFGPFTVEISAGERLAVGVQSTVTDGNRLIDVALYCLK